MCRFEFSNFVSIQYKFSVSARTNKVQFIYLYSFPFDLITISHIPSSRELQGTELGSGGLGSQRTSIIYGFMQNNNL